MPIATCRVPPCLGPVGVPPWLPTPQATTSRPAARTKPSLRLRIRGTPRESSPVYWAEYSYASATLQIAQLSFQKVGQRLYHCAADFGRGAARVAEDAVGRHSPQALLEDLWKRSRLGAPDLGLLHADQL